MYNVLVHKYALFMWTHTCNSAKKKKKKKPSTHKEMHPRTVFTLQWQTIFIYQSLLSSSLEPSNTSLIHPWHFLPFLNKGSLWTDMLALLQQPKLHPSFFCKPVWFLPHCNSTLKWPGLVIESKCRSRLMWASCEAIWSLTVSQAACSQAGFRKSVGLPG